MCQCTVRYFRLESELKKLPGALYTETVMMGDVCTYRWSIITKTMLCATLYSIVVTNEREIKMRALRNGWQVAAVFTIASLVAVFANFSAAGVPATNTVGKVMPDASLVRPVTTGDKAPGVTVHDINGKPFNLGKAFTRKPTVLIFYRGGWCPFCNLQMSQLESIQPKLIKMGYQLLAIGMDNPAHMKASIQRHQLTYTLLSDSDAVAAKAYGLAFHVDDTMVQIYKGYNINLDEASGNSNHILPVPAVYLVGTDHIIRFSYYNPDYKVRIAPDKLLAAADQYEATMKAHSK